MEDNKQKIIEIFNKNVKGKTSHTEDMNQRHDGKKGHWLEQQFLIQANAKNEADILGYELKNQTTSKTTFGDWSANRYIYYNSPYAHLFKGINKYEKQDSFCRIFGQYNEKKQRYSWSGKPVPKIDVFNDYGQIMIIEDSLDICIYYSFSKDKRNNKYDIVPMELQQDNLLLARWFGINSPSNKRCDKSLKYKLEDKFNKKGWFICKMDAEGKYDSLCFGNPITYDKWIELVKKGIVFLDSGMYEGNKRPYSQWRADNKYWDSLIVEIYQ